MVRFGNAGIEIREFPKHRIKSFFSYKHAFYI